MFVNSEYCYSLCKLWWWRLIFVHTVYSGYPVAALSNNFTHVTSYMYMLLLTVFFGIKSPQIYFHHFRASGILYGMAMGYIIHKKSLWVFNHKLHNLCKATNLNIHLVTLQSIKLLISMHNLLNSLHCNFDVNLMNFVLYLIFSTEIT